MGIIACVSNLCAVGRIVQTCHFSEYKYLFEFCHRVAPRNLKICIRYRVLNKYCTATRMCYAEYSVCRNFRFVVIHYSPIMFILTVI